MHITYIVSYPNAGLNIMVFLVYCVCRIKPKKKQYHYGRKASDPTARKLLAGSSYNGQTQSEDQEQHQDLLAIEPGYGYMHKNMCQLNNCRF